MHTTYRGLGTSATIILTQDAHSNHTFGTSLRTGMKRISGTFQIHLRPALAYFVPISVGLMAIGCGNFVAGGDIDVGVQAFRDYMPSVSQEVPIGKTVKVDNFAVTVTGVRSTDGRDNQLLLQVAPEGQRYVLVNVVLENQGDALEYVATRMTFGLFDSMGHQQEWASYIGAVGSIDGRIEPGGERAGELTWAVPENAEGLMLVFGDVAFPVGDASGYQSEPASRPAYRESALPVDAIE